ncbi:MAG: hypothetical protein JNM80_06400 [Phycisphaerae bacterium]|nr:hypothetical protein [Phycisphaerae bacterium]
MMGRRGGMGPRNDLGAAGPRGGNMPPHQFQGRPFSGPPIDGRRPERGARGSAPESVEACPECHRPMPPRIKDDLGPRGDERPGMQDDDRPQHQRREDGRRMRDEQDDERPRPRRGGRG